MSSRPHGIRHINEPIPAFVTMNEGRLPDTVQWTTHSARMTQRGERKSQQRREIVEHILDSWYVDDGWWTNEPVRRMYYECQMSNGAHIVLVWDLRQERWYVQR